MATLTPFQRRVIEILEKREDGISTIEIEPLAQLPTLTSKAHRLSFIYGELKSLCLQGQVDPATIHPVDPHKTTFLIRRPRRD